MIPTAPIPLVPDPLTFPLQPGDLLFMDLHGPHSSQAIGAVKTGIRGSKISHVGVHLALDGAAYVLEAYPPAVQLTPLSGFLKRAVDTAGRPRACVGRLKPPHQPLIPAALQHGLSLQKIPYDFYFLPDKKAYYCSELVVSMFEVANKGQSLFTPDTLSFADPQTGQILPFWITYYANAGLTIPQGQPGSHPARLSNADCLDIVARLGDIHGWTEPSQPPSTHNSCNLTIASPVRRR